MTRRWSHPSAADPLICPPLHCHPRRRQAPVVSPRREQVPALSFILKGLVASGMVCALPPQQSGRTQTQYLVANRYYAGEAFPRAGSKRVRDVEEVVDEVRARLPTPDRGRAPPRARSGPLCHLAPASLSTLRKPS